VSFDKRTRVACCIVGLLTISGASVSHAQQYPVDQSVPGGVAVIALPSKLSDEPRARFGRTPILVLNRNGVWLGVVGLDLDMALGNYLITVTTAEDEFSLNFAVTPFSYSFEQSAEKPRLPPDRISKFPWRPELDASLPLMNPVKATRMSQFGTRYANDVNVRPVRWAILEGINAIEVFAPGRGVVVDVEEFGESNYYIAIDHGMGLQSRLGPLAQLSPAVGDSVKRGEKLGELEAGASGSRSLYWKVLLNGVAVNPNLVTDQLPAPGLE